MLTIGERSRVGLTRTRLSGGLPPSSIDDATLQILEMQAWLAVALDESPEWAKHLSEFRDVTVLGKIYAEVLAHEERFWEAESSPAGSTSDADTADPA